MNVSTMASVPRWRDGSEANVANRRRDVHAVSSILRDLRIRDLNWALDARVIDGIVRIPS